MSTPPVTVVASAPLVRMEIRESSSRPVPGNYYQAADGSLLLCVAQKHGAQLYYWFVSAADSPLIVLSQQQLDETPIETVSLIPVKEHVVCGI